MSNRKTIQKSSNSSTEDTFSIISDALSGTTGGALLGSSFGIIAGVLGGLIGGFFTGYSGYQLIHKKQLAAKNKESIKSHNY